MILCGDGILSNLYSLQLRVVLVFNMCYFINIEAILLCKRTENCLKKWWDFHIKNILPYLILVLWCAECITLHILRLKHFQACWAATWTWTESLGGKELWRLIFCSILLGMKCLKVIPKFSRVLLGLCSFDLLHLTTLRAHHAGPERCKIREAQEVTKYPGTWMCCLAQWLGSSDMSAAWRCPEN